MNSGDLVFPVYEFRPTPCFFSGKFRRYADGAWLADDGEYDIAFINAEHDYWAPICLMVEMPYQKNISWKWLTTHWSADQPLHKGGNPWHYMLHEGATEWGGDWGRDRHPNTRAGRAGMDKICGERRCANGRHVAFVLDDPTISAGLVRNRDTKIILSPPKEPICMYCGLSWMRDSRKTA